MFEAKRQRSTLGLIFNLAEMTFHASVRKVRQAHRNALMAIILNIFQSVLFIAAFYLMFNVLGTRGVAIRGDFMLYLLTGIFLYLTHIKALGAVLGSEGPASPMMMHAQMNTIVAIVSSALSALYLQTISLFVLLFLIHVLINPVEIQHWDMAFMMYLLAWFSGCAAGIVLLALKPWLPDLISIIQMVYVRANMIASGKMFVANMLPSALIGIFDWNPLFHIIDQMRGFVFINYNPHHSNWEYPIYVSIALVTLGLMGEFYSRKHASASWSAGR
ncbi:ABC transporter permease [Rhodophyticola sp. CCM32]|uniref:ABC transporter permease n=1 Tax=Rhodophyticola sp. CCM32 TaxID=2916397 RepID=UPI00107F59FD|nr:ABC transporter permease [Rhodophyticola sp. CCM32]QBY02044.1 ABC transporter permease [Rhodophyticola sp. CCM32]